MCHKAARKLSKKRRAVDKKVEITNRVRFEKVDRKVKPKSQKLLFKIFHAVDQKNG